MMLVSNRTSGGEAAALVGVPYDAALWQDELGGASLADMVQVEVMRGAALPGVRRAVEQCRARLAVGELAGRRRRHRVPLQRPAALLGQLWGALARGRAPVLGDRGRDGVRNAGRARRAACATREGGLCAPVLRRPAMLAFASEVDGVRVRAPASLRSWHGRRAAHKAAMRPASASPSRWTGLAVVAAAGGTLSVATANPTARGGGLMHVTVDRVATGAGCTPAPGWSRSSFRARTRWGRGCR